MELSVARRRQRRAPRWSGWIRSKTAAPRELLYVDQAHSTPRTSERVAGCIADQLREGDLVQ
jgi:hypothetical protein